MTPFAVVVAWDDRALKSVEWMLDPIRGRCGEGQATVAVPGAVAAVGLRAVISSERAEQGVFVDQRNRRLFVGDVRIYDRERLVDRLGAERRDEPDLSLVARCFERFGERAPSYIVGDFAVVVFEWEPRKVFAFRDHFGLRPLYYRVGQDGIALASDVRQLLVHAPEDREIDLQTTLDYLLFRRAHHGRTFFRSIRQVWPAHILAAHAGTLEQTRYWDPPTQSWPLGEGYEQAVEEWRRIFRIAVRDRLRSAYPLGAYLSGGLDSGSIVGAAHEAYEAQDEDRAPLYTLSAQFPGLARDETGYIDAVSRQTPLFDSIRWNGMETNSDDLDRPVEAMPGLREGIGRGPRSEIPALHERGARVVLAGTGGDELGWSHGIFRDLLWGGHLAMLGREVWTIGSIPRALRGVRGNLRRVGPGAPPPEEPPDWFGPELARILPGEPDDTSAGDFRFPSHVQEQAWQAMQLPQASVVIDVSAQALADGGFELRLPYRDVRLAEFVLKIPWRFRVPRGDIRRLQRDSVAAFLPRVVWQRLAKSVADTSFAHQLRVNMERIQALLAGSRWESAPFVSQRGARRMLNRLRAIDPRITTPRPWLSLWQIAVFETWLRAGRGL